MKNRKKLPIGIENFEEIRTEGFYYVDKTGLIQELLDHFGKVNLFTRPRRFGKSLTMSMLRYFFGLDCDKALFDGLAIAKEEALCKEYMGKFPVISLSLKGVDGRNYETARAMLCAIIGNEAMRFQFLLQSERLTEKEKGYYDQLTNIGKGGEDPFIMSDTTLCDSLRVLSALLQKHYDHKVIILIDEYDVPLDKAQQAGYYDSMISLIRSLFGQALKTNDSLYLAVLTGCLRISKESIFTGLNNLQVFSVKDTLFEEQFGFTDGEVEELLSYYGLSKYEAVMREWYDGYRFGSIGVYCPWDIINYCRDLQADPDAQPEAYWINTSGNAIIRRFLQMAYKQTTKQEIELLIAGGTVQKEIHMELTYRDLDQSIDNLWSVLYATGYLTGRKLPGGRNFELKIPNQEIREIFTGQ